MAESVSFITIGFNSFALGFPNNFWNCSVKYKLDHQNLSAFVLRSSNMSLQYHQLKSFQRVRPKETKLLSY